MLILVAYGNSLDNVFLSDDISEIVQNPHIGSFNNIISNPFGFIRLSLYWLAFQIGGLNPTIFRLINIFFHTGTVFLIYILLSHFHSKKVAIITASIFAVHPAISEAVSWISGGSYPQYTFFFLLSLLFYFLSSKGVLIYLLSIIFFIFSFMSHPQMPLSLFLIFPLWEFCFGNFKKRWKKSIPYLFVTFIFALITLNSLSSRTTTLQTTHYQEGGFDNPFLIIPIAISSYLELIFVPLTLTLYHSELSPSTYDFILRLILTILLLSFTILSFQKSKRIFFYLALFWISLSPTLTPFRLNWIVAERYLYLPILGILVVVVSGLITLSQKLRLKWLDYTSITLILILFTIRTIIRNIDWQNEDNLWIATGKTSPSSPNTHNNLGDVYGRWGDKQAALREFQTAIALKPNYGDAYHNLANTYRELGEKEKALENYKKAAEFNPNLWQSYQNIGAIYFEDKQYDKAIEYIQIALSINPKNINLINSLGVLYLTTNNKQKAMEIFNLVLSADPQNQVAKQGLLEASN